MTGTNLTAIPTEVQQGTWTPTLSGATTTTYTTNTGTWTRIGRRVMFDGRITINSVGDGSTGTIANLPFVSAAASAVTVGYFAGSATNYISMVGQIGAGGNAITLRALAVAAAALGTAVFFASGADIIFSGQYTV